MMALLFELRTIQSMSQTPLRHLSGVGSTALQRVEYLPCPTGTISVRASDVLADASLPTPTDPLLISFIGGPAMSPMLHAP